MDSESRYTATTEPQAAPSLGEDIAAVRAALAVGINDVIAAVGGLVPAARALGVDKSVLSVARIGGRISRGSTRILRDALASRNVTKGIDK